MEAGWQRRVAGWKIPRGRRQGGQNDCQSRKLSAVGTAIARACGCSPPVALASLPLGTLVALAPLPFMALPLDMFSSHLVPLSSPTAALGWQPPPPMPLASRLGSLLTPSLRQLSPFAPLVSQLCSLLAQSLWQPTPLVPFASRLRLLFLPLVPLALRFSRVDAVGTPLSHWMYVPHSTQGILTFDRFYSLAIQLREAVIPGCNNMTIGEVEALFHRINGRRSARQWRNFFDSDGEGGRCIAFPIEQVRDARLLPHSATALRDAPEIAERTGRSVDEFVLGMLRADTVATLTLGQSDGSSVNIDQDSESQAVNTATQDATAASLPFSTLTDNFEQPAIGQLTDSPADTDRNGEVQSDTATALDATAALPSAGSPADNRDIAMAPSVAELTPTHHGVSDSAQLAFSKFEVGKVRDYTTAGGLLDSAITARVRRRF